MKRKKLNIRENVPLSDLTTFKVGGYAKYFAEARNETQLRKAIKFAKDKSLSIFVLGGGSDILVSDEGFKGLVLRYKGRDIEFEKKNGDFLVTVEAGLVWDELVKEAVERGLQGIECLSGIPGTVGAAPIQNIGAYGQELKDVFVELLAYDFKKEEFLTMKKKDCEFSYRDSIFKKPENKGRYIITSITLELKKRQSPTLTYQSLLDYLKEKEIKRPTLAEVRKAVLDLRGRKLEDPNVLGNAGSFFKNPIVDDEMLTKVKESYPEVPFFEVDGQYKLFAGWLIDEAGWKGKGVGGARVSKRNALVLTNPKGESSAEDIRRLAEAIKKDVKKKFGVVLEPEVQFIGF